MGITRGKKYRGTFKTVIVKILDKGEADEVASQWVATLALTRADKSTKQRE